jgi:hypothetical protein
MERLEEIRQNLRHLGEPAVQEVDFDEEAKDQLPEVHEQPENAEVSPMKEPQSNIAQIQDRKEELKKQLEEIV